MKWRKYTLLFLITVFGGVGLWDAIAQPPTKPQIVFGMNTDIYVMDTDDIYVMNRDGSDVRRLTEHPFEANWPRWFDPALVVSVSRQGKLPSIWGRLKTVP